jgi:hypothetical protein
MLSVVRLASLHAELRANLRDLGGEALLFLLEKRISSLTHTHAGSWMVGKGNPGWTQNRRSNNNHFYTPEIYKQSDIRPGREQSVNTSLERRCLQEAAFLEQPRHLLVLPFARLKLKTTSPKLVVVVGVRILTIPGERLLNETDYARNWL